MELPVRIIPMPHETIFSYLLRLSNVNCMELLELWNCCKSDYFASKNDIPALIYSPQTTIDVLKLSELSGLTIQQILGLSFYNLLAKFKGTEQTPRSRVLMGMLHKEYHYCQDCLEEEPYHQLLWSIRGIDMCYKHKTKLHHSCIHCNRTISLKDLKAFDFCPYCNGKLAERTTSAGTIIVEEQEWLISNFIFLNSDNGISIGYQDLAVRILYVLNEYNRAFNQELVYKALDNNIEKISSLLKRVRGTLKQSINLSFIFEVLNQKKWTIEQLLSVEVAEEFIHSIIQRKSYLRNRLKCLAPWCSQRGDFIKTATHYEINSKGKFKNYVICKKCGCRYGVAYNNKLIEMSKFIGIYDYLTTKNVTRINLMKSSAESGYSFGMLRKAVAYFTSRGVLSFDNYKVGYKVEHLNSFLAALQRGATINSIGRWDIWSCYYEFLYYRYHIEVLTFEMEKIKGRETRKPSLRKDKLEKIILPILNDMVNMDEDISIKNVCLRAHISPATLRLWEGNPIVASMKEKQLRSRQNRFINTLRESIEKYFNDYDNHRVSAATLYNYIGIKRNDLWRLSPDITSEMNERIRKHNKLFKQQNQ